MLLYISNTIIMILFADPEKRGRSAFTKNTTLKTRKS